MDFKAWRRKLASSKNIVITLIVLVLSTAIFYHYWNFYHREIPLYELLVPSDTLTDNITKNKPITLSKNAFQTNNNPDSLTPMAALKKWKKGSPFSGKYWGFPGLDMSIDSPYNYEFARINFENRWQFYDDTVNYSIFYGCNFDTVIFGPLQFPSDKSIMCFNSCKFTEDVRFTTMPFDHPHFSMGNMAPISNNRMSQLSFSDCKFSKKLGLEGCRFHDSAVINFFLTQLPETLRLSEAHFLKLHMENVTVKKNKAWWSNYKLLNFLISPFINPEKPQKCVLLIDGIDLNLLQLDYSYFQLGFSRSLVNDVRESIYQKLLEKFKNDGQTKSYELLDVEYHNYRGGFFNFLSRWWWNYGYSKERIFFWSFFFALVFTIFNYLKIPIILSTYNIQSVDNYYKQVQANSTPWQRSKIFFISAVYTSILFFGIKLDPEKMDFSKTYVAMILLLQFITGLICAGFIINLIIG